MGGLVAAIGDADCERLISGLLAQPINAWSSAAYLVAGGWILWQAYDSAPGRRLMPAVFGCAVGAVGLGSIAFHGPQPPGAAFLHDLPIAGVLAFIGLHGAAAMAGWREQVTLGLFAATVAAAAVVLAIWPDVYAALFVVLALGAAAGELGAARPERRHRRRDYVAGLAVLAVGLVLNGLGRTGGPLCDAAGPVQLHAVWHLATALFLAIWGRVALTGQPGALSGPPTAG